VGAGTHEGATLRDYVQVVRRRLWLILLVALLAPAAAVAISLNQEKLFQASSQVYVSRQSPTSLVTGNFDPNSYANPDRLIATQAKIARARVIAKRTLAAAQIPGLTVDEFLANSSVTGDTNTDLLTFRVTSPSVAYAERLASGYAHQFKAYSTELASGQYKKSLQAVNRQLTQLRREGRDNGTFWDRLVDEQQQLQAFLAVQTSNTHVIQEAREAPQVQPRPVRNGILGFALGLIAGLGLAFLWEALDTRVRNADEVHAALGIPLLGRLPEPPRRLARRRALAMLEAPKSEHAEPFRILRNNLEFARLDRDVKTIMITSAIEGEGKSTTIANLAVAAARGGKRVIVADFDLRRPSLHDFFDLEEPVGLTQVALGHATLDDALVTLHIAVPDGGEPAPRANGRKKRGENGNGYGDIEGVLQVLPAGPLPPDTTEFLQKRAVAQIIAELRERADLVLLDATPLLVVGDASALAGMVDGIVVAAKTKQVRKSMLREIARILDGLPAEKLGFVATGAELGGAYYGYGAHRYHGSRKDKRAAKESIST
jgi:Mrp family chromosome partitioning ATPase